MRRKFGRDLYELMCNDSNIILITADMGFGMLDKIRNNLPAQFYNVGASEQVMMDMAVGMAFSGRIPITYSITPFLLFRPFEVIRNYINKEMVPVIMVGSGRDDNYKHEGFSHFAGDDYILESLENIVILKPEGDFDLKEIVYMNKPVYLNLKR